MENYRSGTHNYNTMHENYTECNDCFQPYYTEIHRYDLLWRVCNFYAQSRNALRISTVNRKHGWWINGLANKGLVENRVWELWIIYIISMSSRVFIFFYIYSMSEICYASIWFSFWLSTCRDLLGLFWQCKSAAYISDHRFTAYTRKEYLDIQEIQRKVTGEDWYHFHSCPLNVKLHIAAAG